MMRRYTFALLAALPLAQGAAPDAVEIVRRSMNHDQDNWQRAKDYTFEQKSVSRTLDEKGAPTKTRSRTHEILVMYGRPIGRLVEKDGKPLTGDDKRKEDEKFDKEVEKRRKENQEENSKERRKYLKKREEERRFAREVPEAFNFTLLGEEKFGGRDMYVIGAEPKPGYQPRDSQARMLLPKLRGKLWIDKEEYQWVKIEAETIDTISFGLFLARVGRGAQLTFEQSRVNDELWLPSHGYIKLDGRLALFKKMRADAEVHFGKYRKFQTDSKLIVAEQ
jgi:hypothetical protein